MTRELGPRASAGTPRQAAEFGTVLLFAVPYDALPQLGRDLQEVLRGKIVLDACNPSSESDNALAREAQSNGVAKTSAKYLPGTRPVRAFSAVDATAIDASAKRQSGKLGVPLAGDDAEAVQVDAQLVRDAGCEPVVVGDLAVATSFQRGGPGFRANTTARNCVACSACPKGTNTATAGRGAAPPDGVAYRDASYRIVTTQTDSRLAQGLRRIIDGRPAEARALAGRGSTSLRSSLPITFCARSGTSWGLRAGCGTCPGSSPARCWPCSR